ncbi:MAG: SIMPL domain-containing protein, partial [Crocinitomicaceae bacterium]|nr:SIMPL domain-containing protein [Crocinitomicaceae bacterium]
GDDFTAAYETRFYSLELNNPATYTKFISEIYNIQGASYTLGEYTYSKINEIKDKAYREAWTDAQNRANMLLALGGYKTSGVNSMEDMSMNYIPMSGSNNYYYDDTTLSTNTELLVSFSAQLRVVYLFAK